MDIGSAPGARRLVVVPEEPLLGGDRYDYADAFEVAVRPSDARSSEQLARAALERMPWSLRFVVGIAQRRVLGLRLGPRSSPDHVLGWPIVTASDDVVQLEASSPLLRRAVIVGRRPTPDAATISTFVFYARPAGRVVWRLVGPVHRMVAPYLMARAAREQ